MPVKDQAAYMRKYRAKKKADHVAYDAAKPIIGAIKTEASEFRQTAAKVIDHLHERIGELEGEVARLKRELAARPASMTVAGLTPAPGKGRPMTIAFNPAPKPGKGR